MFPLLEILVLCALAVVVGAREEGFIWPASVVAVLLSFGPHKVPGPILAVLAGLLIIRSLRGLGRRFLVGAVVCAWGSILLWGWKAGPFPRPHVILTLAAVALLAVIGFRFRWLGPLWPALPMLLATRWPASGLGAIGRGVVMLVVGFITLAIGLMITLRLARRAPPPPPEGDPSVEDRSPTDPP